ncbi:MAG: dienelactone hydrolase family protein [Alphaproteobacteria bacterium]
MMRYLLTFFSVATLSITTALSVAHAGGHGNKLQYEVNGKNFAAHVESAGSDAKGIIYIVHDWDGLNDYEINRAKMLKDMGYTAIAIDLFGVDAKLEGRDDYRRETGALYGNRDEFRARIAAALAAGGDIETAGNKSFIIGYCFGGAAVLESARAGMPLDGYVSFHGGLGTPDGQDYANTKAPVLLLHGSADPVSGMDDLAALLNQLQAAGVAHDAEVFGGARHSFTVAGSRDYDESADSKSWDALMRFLARNS